MDHDSVCEPTVPPGAGRAGRGAFQAALLASRLAPHLFASEIGALMKASRTRSEISGLGGAVVSDGERFAQLVEGSEQAIDDWLDALRRDARHADVHVLWRGPVDARAFDGQWRVGWTGADTLDSFEADPSPGVVGRFVELIDASDSW